MTIREANSGDATDLARLTAELGYTGSEDLMRRRLARSGGRRSWAWRLFW
jgi:hypothetical protein